ncbi:unnamed protein product [Rotaria socialis]|uniref:Eukaryotic translation initiation factor 3 subunit A n=1 Tax=Rotaria socialis TaxID=392032 RepID=A0A820SJ18_9BILA|nr:unnamed protein product [Rotaria socialis]CAF4456940.1 unnamed protein product [Rotaria socialis]
MVFMKPESALKRADELIEVGRKQRALETLLEVIKSRRHRTWTITHEPLMEKLLELCVDLKKNQIAKDGLHQYKTIAQTVSAKSLELVIMKFLNQGELRCTNARKEATNALVDIDDLEVLQSPESLLLSAVSGESQQDRTDRDMLAPWLKFVWESYKQCLDLLKNNNRVEKIYQEVAQMGFRFCQQYNRRPEFRKLCDTIRTHFTQSQKYSKQAFSVDFTEPTTQALHLETRLMQLDTAIAMELWQEAFKAVEDIHEFTTISKKTPKPPQLAAYYSKVALVFLKAGNYVFHATTVLKLYVLHKELKKNITHTELTRLSTKALLAILSIPLPTPRTQIDEHLETEETLNQRQKRLTGLLALQEVPTRATLVRDMIKQGVLNFVHPELKNMYEWLEVEFHPLRISSKMEEGIQFVENLAQPEYSQYMPALRDVTVVRLLQQVSQVYQTIELKRFISLAPPMDRHRLEKIIVNAARNNDVQVHIEHKLQALTFGTDLNMSIGKSSGVDSGSKANIIQKMPNEQIRHQLTAISRALYSCIEIINEKSNKERNDKLRRQIAQTYHHDEAIERKEVLKRRELIERYKEEKEKKYQEKVREIEIDTAKKRVERDEEDKNRREADLQRRLVEAAVEKEKEEHRFAMKMAIDKLRESEIGRKIIEVIGEEELYKYDPNSINSLHIDAVIKHSREQKEKLKIQYKRVDFIVRAQHESEVLLLQKQAEDEMNLRRETQLAEHQRTLEKRERLTRMVNDKNAFLRSIVGQRHQEYLQEMEEFNQRLQVAREQRLEQLRQEYVAKRKEDFKRDKKLEKLRKQQEKQQKIEAENRRQVEESLAIKRSIDEEKNKKFAEQARKQREREEEIERRLLADKVSSHVDASPVGGRRVAPTTGTHQQDKNRPDSGMWRRNAHGNEEKSPVQTDTKDSGHTRNEEQRLRIGGERRFDDSSSNKGSSNEPWRPRTKPDLQNRDDRRDDRREDRRGYSSQQQQTQGGSSFSTSERRTDRNSETADKWQTVEKRRANPPRTNYDRPSQQRSEELSSGGAWRTNSRAAPEQRDEPKDTGRSGPQSSTNWGRSDQNDSWRTRERTRLNSWRTNEGDENESNTPRPSGDSAPSNDDRRNDHRRTGGTFGTDRRGQNRDYGGGNRE